MRPRHGRLSTFRNRRTQLCGAIDSLIESSCNGDRDLFAARATKVGTVENTAIKALIADWAMNNIEEMIVASVIRQPRT